MALASISTLVAGGIVVVLALISCGAMLIAFRVQRSHGRWGDTSGSDPEDHDGA